MIEDVVEMGLFGFDSCWKVSCPEFGGRLEVG